DTPSIFPPPRDEGGSCSRHKPPKAAPRAEPARRISPLAASVSAFEELCARDPWWSRPRTSEGLARTPWVRPGETPSRHGAATEGPPAGVPPPGPPLLPAWVGTGQRKPPSPRPDAVE